MIIFNLLPLFLTLRCPGPSGTCQCPTGLAFISWSISWCPRARLLACSSLCVSCSGMAEKVDWRGAQSWASWHLCCLKELDCEACQKGTCHQNTKEPGPDYCSQALLDTWQEMSSLPGGGGVEAGPGCRRVPKERLGDGLGDTKNNSRAWPSLLSPSEELGRSQQCAWNGTRCPVSVFKSRMWRAAPAEFIKLE